jgi:hypothetical protein
MMMSSSDKDQLNARLRQLWEEHGNSYELFKAVMADRDLVGFVVQLGLWLYNREEAWRLRMGRPQ